MSAINLSEPKKSKISLKKKLASKFPHLTHFYSNFFSDLPNEVRASVFFFFYVSAMPKSHEITHFFSRIDRKKCELGEKSSAARFLAQISLFPDTWPGGASAFSTSVRIEGENKKDWRIRRVHKKGRCQRAHLNQKQEETKGYLPKIFKKWTKNYV